MVGQALAHYRILQKLGEGGMGIVYKAHDTHLDRFVAIKVLPPDKVGDPERQRRFVQEARAASALNHPGIVTVHDIATADGVTFIVMEYVAGKALDQVLARKALRLNEALDYGVQVAEALSAAHDAGIVHRDLKPANVMIGDDGRVRILDFGLAKLTSREEGGDLAPTVTASPISEAGTVVGTFAYMSPEQADGKRVDARSDIFSFGVVLYEMFVRRHPFRRESRLSTMAAIVGEEPRPLNSDGAELPQEIDRAVLRCLRKDPARRWQSMSDLKSVLEDLKEESKSGAFRAGAAAGARPSRRAHWTALALGAVVIVMVVAFGAIRLRAPVPVPALDLVPLTLDAGFSGWSSLSRDGKIVAYASDRGTEGTFDIWVRDIDRPQPVRRTHDPAGAYMPAVSPDGSRIVFQSGRDGGGLYIMDTLGGEERKLVSGGILPRFSPDGKWILCTRQTAGDQSENKTLLVSPDGGEPRPLHPGFVADLDQNGIGPVWSPDSRLVLFGGTRKSDGRHGWWIAPADGGATRAVDTSTLSGIRTVLFPAAWPWDDTVILSEGSTIEGINLYRVGMTTGAWRLTGARVPLTSGPGLRYDASVSSSGRLVFSILTWVSNLRKVPLDVQTGLAAGDAQVVTHDTQTKEGLCVTPDGSKAVYSALVEFARSTQAPRVETRLRDMASGRETLLASGTGAWKRSRISRDGTRVAYREVTPEGAAAFVSSASDEGRLVCKGCRILDFFPDPDEVLVLVGENRIVRQRLSTGSQTTFIAPPAGTITDARLSGDGRWAGFVVNWPGGRSGLYVAPVRQTASADREWMPIEESETVRSAEPCWSPDGKMLYYMSARDGFMCVWARRFDPATGRPAGTSVPAFHAHTMRHSFYAAGYWPWGLSATRDHLYMLMSEVTSNVWTATLPR